MRALKTTLLAGALAFSLASAAADDGTFTINIQGPDSPTYQDSGSSQAEEQHPQRIQEAPLPSYQRGQQTRRNRARSVARQTAQALSQAPARTRAAVPAEVQQPQAPQQSQPQSQTQGQAQGQAQNQSGASDQGGSRMPSSVRVGPGESLWQVATRLLPADRSVNEFQIAASIYRNNPQAFNDGNAGSIRQGALKIPPVSEIAREDPKVGSDLLARGNIAMPPLGPAKAAPAQQSQGGGVIARSEQNPTFTATETANRQFQEERKARREKLEAQDAAAQAVAANPKGASEADKALAEGKDGNAQSSAQPQNPDDSKVQSGGDASEQAKIDAGTLKQMLDGSRDAMNIKSKEIDKKLVEAIDRMQKSNESTLTAANSAVSGIAKQYDSTIASLQQNITELKGQVSKLTRDNDRMRDMLLATDDKLQSLQAQIANGSAVPGDAASYQRSLILIIAGIGLLTLMLLMLFVFFKVKSRQRGRTIESDISDEDTDKEPSEEDKLLSDTISPAEASALDAAAQADQQDDHAGSQGAEGQQPQQADGQAQSEAQAAHEQAAAPQGGAAAPEAQEAAAPAAKDEAQKAWDAAAAEKGSGEKEKDPDKDAMVQWAAAMAQQNAEQEKTADVGGSSGSDDGADAWAAAMAEQKAGEQGGEQKGSDDGADAWAAAMAEQKAGEQGGEQKGSDDGADAWAAAMAEHGPRRWLSRKPASRAASHPRALTTGLMPGLRRWPSRKQASRARKRISQVLIPARCLEPRTAWPLGPRQWPPTSLKRTLQLGRSRPWRNPWPMEGAHPQKLRHRQDLSNPGLLVPGIPQRIQPRMRKLALTATRTSSRSSQSRRQAPMAQAKMRPRAWCLRQALMSLLPMRALNLLIAVPQSQRMMARLPRMPILKTSRPLPQRQ